MNIQTKAPATVKSAPWSPKVQERQPKMNYKEVLKIIEQTPLIHKGMSLYISPML